MSEEKQKKVFTDENWDLLRAHLEERAKRAIEVMSFDNAYQHMILSCRIMIDETIQPVGVMQPDGVQVTIEEPVSLSQRQPQLEDREPVVSKRRVARVDRPIEEKRKIKQPRGNRWTN